MNTASSSAVRGLEPNSSLAEVRFLGTLTPEQAALLSPPELRRVLAFLHYEFEPRRQGLLLERSRKALEIDGGVLPHFSPATKSIRDDPEWRCAPIPTDIQDRRVEITGPIDRKMVINGLNSGAKVYMADFEDSSSPTWENMINGQINLRDAVRGTIVYTAPDNPKRIYQLKEKTATLFVRPRGLHLDEAHVTVGGEPVAAGLFDLAVYLFYNARNLVDLGRGPYLYIPKIEYHVEARWWNDVFSCIEQIMGLPGRTIRATALIETLTAAFEMEEILYELREHSLGLNCGRWDYAFSFIKRLKASPHYITPDRKYLTMTSPFMQAYVTTLIHICHKRGTFAMGGMAAQIPIRGGGNEAEAALESVRADKLREVLAGHDGTWVAHPGLIPLALKIFDQHMPTENQIHDVRPLAAPITAEDLLRLPSAGSSTLNGLRENIFVVLEYTKAWLKGIGCIPLHNKMEDAATAEISRVQVHQWLRHEFHITIRPKEYIRWLDIPMDDFLGMQ
ncbi:hypothetical protein NSK_005389 [Nannochloropsis salina CCMP1776]|uniref:malate synthase n=1 Tax=Nannochloropsis salina CCMP1776 TaxID=1027361 RepID=A0A4D9D1F5_9STRA|nr:hypothetical protein NSK_005389 [Nannochloropsis salina CCMP1776]|eukprot:TFJ83325.1 hypothetical protein NSK_005389 [Nannochloropsis salina CCMP1776]